MLRLFQGNANENQTSSDEKSIDLRMKCRCSENWSILPSPALEMIFSYLDRNDQCNMSLVCKNWSKEYGSPGLWKNITFSLTDREWDIEICPEVKFSKKFGCMFRNVEIIGNFLTRDASSKVNRQLNMFFEGIMSSGCQLDSIKFKSMFKFHQYLNETESSLMFKRATEFISTQHHLKAVEFYNCFYKIEDGHAILKVICENNSKTLKSLILEGFVRDKLQLEAMDMESNRALMQHLMSLKILKTDYSQLFEDLMRSLSDQENISMNYCARTLSLMDINCEGSKRTPLKSIPSTCWRSLRKNCPDLKVHLNLTYFGHIRYNIAFYLVDSIPLEKLDCRIEKVLENPPVVYGDLFRNIFSCRTIELLVCLSVVWMPRVDDISTDLIPFLQASKKLRTLQLFVRYPVHGIEVLFASLLDYRPPSLESVHISVTNVKNDADNWDLTTLAEEYNPLFQILHLNVILLTDAE